MYEREGGESESTVGDIIMESKYWRDVKKNP
jgi:hypothetical protein